MFMKRFMVAVIVLLIVLTLFRGFIYRTIVKYDEIGTRSAIEISNPILLQLIESKIANKSIGFKEVIEISRDLTIEQLEFTTKDSSNDPNDLVYSKLANCIGYAAMFNSLANHLINENNLEEEIEAKHRIGKLNLLGIDLHQYFDNPFFKDHDFNDIINKSTGEIVSVDPSLCDYLMIHTISKK